MFDDKIIQKAVIAQLRWEPSIDGAHIGVTASHGVVTLSGHVDNFAAKHAAEATVRLVKGIKAVAEEIEVRLPSDARRDDAVLAAAAIDRLGWDVYVPRTPLKSRSRDPMSASPAKSTGISKKKPPSRTFDGFTACSASPTRSQSGRGSARRT